MATEVERAAKEGAGWMPETARRYMAARYGPSVWFRAPETFGNYVERWIWAIASGSALLAEESMLAIEKNMNEAREAGQI